MPVLRDCSRCDKLIAEMLKATADLMATKADLMTAREVTARLEGELTGLRTRSWWKRLAG